MIDIRYELRNGAHDLSIIGHAGYAAHGEDIVCAGVSSLVYALVGFIVSRDEEPTSDISMGEGYAYITCSTSADIDTAFEMACIGFEQIANTHPANVSYSNTSQ
jgi:uncharacterized protein YsxB (DUF464 family)